MTATYFRADFDLFLGVDVWIKEEVDTDDLPNDSGEFWDIEMLVEYLYSTGECIRDVEVL